MFEKRDRFLSLLGQRSIIMGIVNVTPDSFSDGGRFNSLENAKAQAQKLVAEGADIVDVGAESTRPGHTPVPEDEELRRLEPLLEGLVQAVEAPVSIDTSKAAIARYAISRGVCVVNDVWGLQRDPAMADVIAVGGAAVVIMHNRADVDEKRDIVDDMRRFFDHSLGLAEKAGIPRHHIMLDPGVGFGKTKLQNLEAIAGMTKLQDYGLPFLVGLSRKSLLGSLLGDDPAIKLIGTLAANLTAAAHGASIFRVHDAAEHVTAFKVFDAIERA
ncbi:dihydropteroate synthase [Methyloferula stellata]|uniref:dihydropteroate synthase n=1 Tax=Methyloferula stellata TaxID=876270 RepID=UPI0003A24575|nr:dihydropteroate synthase [Methyloferula stellata]